MENILLACEIPAAILGWTILFYVVLKFELYSWGFVTNIFCFSIDDFITMPYNLKKKVRKKLLINHLVLVAFMLLFTILIFKMIGNNMEFATISNIVNFILFISFYVYLAIYFKKLKKFV